MEETNRRPTQKEAIFTIITAVLGLRFRAGMDARELLYGQNRKHYGRRVHDSAELEAIRIQIANGMRLGKIPCRKMREWKEQGIIFVKSYAGMRQSDPFEEYANRILHYWLKNDSRLSGQKRPKKNFKEAFSKYNRLKNNEPGLAIMDSLMKMNASQEKRDTLKAHIANRKLHLLLKAIDFDPVDFPEELQRELGFLKFKRSAA